MLGSELRGGVGKYTTSAATDFNKAIARTAFQRQFICKITMIARSSTAAKLEEILQTQEKNGTSNLLSMPRG